MIEWGEQCHFIKESLLTGHTIAVSDGSFKDKRGLAAWVLEGESNTGCMIGYNFIPGAKKEQSTYRSELAGLLVVVTMVSELCIFCSIKEGRITIGCDNLSAITLAFDQEISISTNMSDFDILYTIRNTIVNYPISWQTMHVRGH